MQDSPSLEEQLFRDGHQWLQRAVNLYTQTHKIKVWAPIVCSCLLSGYYLYNVHASRAAASNSVPWVAEESHAAPHKGSAAVYEAAPVAAPAPNPSHAEPAPQKTEEAPAPIDPKNVDTLTAWANALQKKGELNGAAALYQKALSKDPKNSDAQTGLALIQLKQNHLREADAAAASILRKAPNNTDALLITGIVAWRQARLADAERIFLRGVELDDQRADFHAFLGRVAEAEGRPQDALRHFERSLALDPNDAEIAARRDRLRGAQ